MGVQAEQTIVTEEEYLEAEHDKDIRHELVNGQVVAKFGGTLNHSLLSTNILTTLHTAVKDGVCMALNADFKVRTSTGNFRYPDAMVNCEPVEDPKAVYIETPKIIVEVLSPSTRKDDEQVKRLEYINISTLEEYVLIDQDKVHIIVFRKSDHWQPTYYYLGDILELSSIGLRVPVVEIYEKVDIPQMQAYWAQQNA